MSKRICLALVVASIAFPAYAAKCGPLDKSKFPAGTKVTTLTPGQTHFAQGAYMVLPPAGPPPGDGVMLFQNPKMRTSLLAFTSGKLVCDVVTVQPEFVAVLLKVGTGPLENDAPLPPPPSHDGELKL